MSPITTHVLDTSLGRPAKGVHVTLERLEGDSARELASGITDNDGRITDLLDSSIETGVYRITFDVGAYFEAREQDAFYPSASIVFNVEVSNEHYHVPLLLNPYGYSTYRGS